MLDAGTAAPRFTAPTQSDLPFDLSRMHGRWVLLWWYTKADTPGGTLEGEGLRDQARMFDELGCVVVGISFDDPADNATFGDKHGFPFDLLSDTDRRIAADYDVLRPSDDPFADYPRRISYLIDPDGVIAKGYEVDDPAGHGAEVLADLRALQS